MTPDHSCCAGNSLLAAERSGASVQPCAPGARLFACTLKSEDVPMITKRTVISAFVLLLWLPAFLPKAEVHAWGSATHAYIADHIGESRGLMNSNEMYGAMAADLFNSVLGSGTGIASLYELTHDQPEKLWLKARRGMEWPVAFGLVSHNDLWGADFTAHHEGQTFGETEGYVIAKARLLAPFVKEQLERVLAGKYSEATLDAASLELAHGFVELAVDLLVKDIDPAIGQKILYAATFRTSQFPALLVKAYSQDVAQALRISQLDAAKIIIARELQFKSLMTIYGKILMQKTADSTSLLAQLLPRLARDALGVHGIQVAQSAEVTGLLNTVLQEAMLLCTPDFAGELYATIDFVHQQMDLHGIVY